MFCAVNDGYDLFLCVLLYSAIGTKVEGILRQAADVEEVDHRVQEYEQGKNSIFLYLELFFRKKVNKK